MFIVDSASAKCHWKPSRLADKWLPLDSTWNHWFFLWAHDYLSTLSVNQRIATVERLNSCCGSCFLKRWHPWVEWRLRTDFISNTAEKLATRCGRSWPFLRFQRWWVVNEKNDMWSIIDKSCLKSYDWQWLVDNCYHWSIMRVIINIMIGSNNSQLVSLLRTDHWFVLRVWSAWTVGWLPGTLNISDHQIHL